MGFYGCQVVQYTLYGRQVAQYTIIASCLSGRQMVQYTIIDAGLYGRQVPHYTIIAGICMGARWHNAPLQQFSGMGANTPLHIFCMGASCTINRCGWGFVWVSCSTMHYYSWWICIGSRWHSTPLYLDHHHSWMVAWAPDVTIHYYSWRICIDAGCTLHC